VINNVDSDTDSFCSEGSSQNMDTHSHNEEKNSANEDDDKGPEIHIEESDIQLPQSTFDKIEEKIAEIITKSEGTDNRQLCITTLDSHLSFIYRDLT
jgi:hypothetical protein